MTPVMVVTFRGGGESRCVAIQRTPSASRSTSTRPAPSGAALRRIGSSHLFALSFTLFSLHQRLGGEPHGGDVDAPQQIEHVHHALIARLAVASDDDGKLRRDRPLLDQPLLEL